MTRGFRDGIEGAIGVLSLMRDDDDLLARCEAAAAACVAALRAGNKVLFAGNGGSAAQAQHWAAELVNRFEADRPGLAAIALTTDASALTAIGNDHGYALTFSRQLEALGRRGDVLVALSTSGRSANVLRAVEAAARLGVVTVGFTGRSGGDLLGRCDHLIRVPSDRTPSIQEGHEVLGHLLCGVIEREMFPA